MAETATASSPPRGAIQRARSFLGATEPYRAAMAFLAGFAYDSATLRRIDQLSDNLLLLAYLVALGALLALDLRVRRGRERVLGFGGDTLAARLEAREPWLHLAIQFLFGGLFSAYVIFYMKSVSLLKTALFLAPLLGLLLANEFLGRRVREERVQLPFYFFCVFSFLLYFIPVATGHLGVTTFWLAAVGAGLACALLVLALERGAVAEERVTRRRRVTGQALSCGGVLALLAALDFAHVIPPVPLALVHSGVYHRVEQAGDAFRLHYAVPPLWRFWVRQSSPFQPREGSAVHCFTAVFAPTGLETQLSHRWERWDEGREAWLLHDAIPIELTGGRAAGFRGTTRKRNYEPGSWRVRVVLEDGSAEGREIGRVPFEIAPSREEPSHRPLELAHIDYR